MADKTLQVRNLIVGDVVRITRRMGDMQEGTEMTVTNIGPDGEITATDDAGRSVTTRDGYRLEFVRRPLIVHERIVLAFIAFCLAFGAWFYLF